MKIGIMTFWWSEDNYGQILQCYALQKYLKDAGHDAYLIRYDPRNDYVKAPIWKKMLKLFNLVLLYRFLRYIKRRHIDLREKKEHPRHFEVFREMNIRQSEKIYYSYDELKKYPPEADLYIVGSDQVWNPDYLQTEKTSVLLRAYFLDFGDKVTKKIAYAASFGKDKLGDDVIKIISPLLQKFDYISVREKSGLDICKQCGINNAEWAPDPTMLLDENIYKTLYKDEFIKKSSKPYCLLYFLGNTNNFSIKNVYTWANKKGIDVIYVSGNCQYDKYKKTYATIPEWICLIQNAHFIITNSYHCSVFSLIFNKQLGVVPLVGGDAGMNNRFSSLFELFNLEDRFLKSDFSIMDINNTNCLKISSILKKIREDGKLKLSI